MKRDDDYKLHTSYEQKGVFQNAFGMILGLGLGILVLAAVVFGAFMLLIGAIFGS